MKVYLNRVTGIDDAIITMFISNGMGIHLSLVCLNCCQKIT